MTDDDSIFEAALRATGWESETDEKLAGGDATGRLYHDNAGLAMRPHGAMWDALRALCEYSREQGRREATPPPPADDRPPPA